MEFFRTVNIDWMGKAKYFIALSLFLLVSGWISILSSHGLRYGIDFRGGTLVYVRFATTPPTAKIRNALAQAGLSGSSIQPINDPSDPRSLNDLMIGLDQQGQGDEALDIGKQAILNVLHKSFGEDTGG